MKNIVFSFIIPCYNRAGLISSTLSAITRQGFNSYEIIVVDDGSQDDTESVLRKWLDNTQITYIKTTNRERGAARNLGMSAAKGSYINYFDSDDILNPCLVEVNDFIIKNGSPPVVFGAIENITNEGQSLGIVTAPYPDFKRNILHNNFLACGSVFIRKDVALRFQFSEDRRLSGTEDWDLWLRMYSAYDFLECPVIVFKQVNHELRSLNQVNPASVEKRENAFAESLNEHSEILKKRFTQRELNLLIADRFTLIALAQIINGNRKKAFAYVGKAVKKSIDIVNRKRFWALVNKLLFI